MQKLIDRTRRINHVLQRTAGQPAAWDELAETLQAVTGASVYVSDARGGLLGHALAGEGCPVAGEAVAAGSWPAAFNRRLLRQDVAVAALPTGESLEGSQETMAAVPIFGGMDRLGTIVLSSRAGKIGEDDLVLAEVAATFAGLDLLRTRTDEAEAEARDLAAVKVAVDTLSYSELGAIQHIFDELNGSEGLVVASKIADRVGITRSVIVNALRKFESAGVIESRSLGMKGTHIRVLNPHLLQELSRRRI